MFACMSSVKSALSFWAVIGLIDTITSPVPFWFSKYAKLSARYLGLAELSFPGLWAYRGQCAGSPVLGDSIKD